MKKPIADSKQFTLLRMLDEFTRKKGISLSDQEGIQQFIKEISSALKNHCETPTVVHGFRIQTMFAYVAAALGGCRIITEQDSGDWFIESADFRRPDFRVLTTRGEEIFVEVKNFDQQQDPMKSLTGKFDYIDSLCRYADAFKKPLFFALYWKRWQIWTLTRVCCFTKCDDICSLALLDALKNDEVAVLGDCRIGVSKPLAIRFYTDSTKPRRVNLNGDVQFTIGGVTLFAGGREITAETEQKLAWFFLNHARGDEFDQHAHVENRELLWIDLIVVKDDPNPDQGFLVLGSLSEMISEQFNSLTVDQGEVSHLSPQVDLERLGVAIPRNYKGEVLGIWRFYQQTALSETKKQNIPF